MAGEPDGLEGSARDTFLPRARRPTAGPASLWAGFRRDPLDAPPDLLDALDGVRVLRPLVLADADDPRKPQREPALVPAALLDRVERDFQDDLGRDRPHGPVAGDGDPLEE